MRDQHSHLKISCEQGKKRERMRAFTITSGEEKYR